MNVKVTGNEVRPPQGGGPNGVARRESSEGLVAGTPAAPIATEGSTVQIGATTRHLLDLAKSGNATDVVDMAKVERLLNHAVNKDKNGPVFLDELDPSRGNRVRDAPADCGFTCELSQ